MCRLKQLLLLSFIFSSRPLSAQITNIVGPLGSGDFGYSVTALSNGNYVITDPYFYDGTVFNAGAVYLYDGRTHLLISTLKGKNNNDFVGKDGVVGLPNGNFIVLSHSVDNGSIVDCSAITWVNGLTGLSGVVSPDNSLFGTATNDSLGSGDNNGQGGIVVFDNGNYAVVTPGWDNGSIVNAGAVTLLDGNSPTSGFISSANSLVGSNVNDRVGSDGIFILDNNHFIVRSFSWNNGTAINAGAMTWCNGISLTGQVSTTNSLVGTTTGDFFGDIIPAENRIKKLTNGNFVVINPNWDDIIAGVSDAGAVTWGSNSFGVSGVISSDNSLVGSTTDDHVGGGMFLDTGGVVALSNGNYIVATPEWDRDNGAVYNAGAVTWGNGTTGLRGFIDATNSLVGSSVQDAVGSGGVVALTNGNYVVGTPLWDNGANENVGAITWGNGSTGTIGEVSIANSLVGSTAMDFISANINSSYPINMIIALSNGNYVVSTPNWDNGNIVDAGAVTWADGNTGIIGEINSGRSLIGNVVNDRLGIHVTALPNGNYVVSSPYWDNGSITNAGAATWANGTIGITGFVDSSNSLVGSQPGDSIGIGGTSYDVTVLNNGNYVVSSPYWDNGAVINAGAATWVNGMTGITGSVSSINSLVGTTTGARVSFSVTTLTNGNYVVESPGWSDGTLSVGAVTWGNGNSGISGPITSSNSLVGSASNPTGDVFLLQNGNYLASSRTGKGSVSWGNGLTGTVGIVSTDNSLVGTSPDDRVGEYLSLSNDHYLVISPHYDNGNITDAGALTIGSTASGVSGKITDCNSVKGTSANNGWHLTYSYDDVFGYMIVGHAVVNAVKLFNPVGVALPVTMDSTIVSVNGNSIVPLVGNDGCHIIATLTPNGTNPISGIVKAKVWKESATPGYKGEPFVSRHYEITPASGAATATAKVTLYFTQEEFDDFNTHPGSTLDLPKNENDAAGVANLRVIKFPGISNNGTGLPGGYPGTPELIDPNDENIVWNESLHRWEVSFDVTGFSGFIVQTNVSVLPLTLLEFTGKLVNDEAIVEWKTTDEVNTASFNIERSIDGRLFVTIGNVAAANQPGVNTYAFSDNSVAALGVQSIYYRLKLIDIDGRFTYSGIIRLALDNKILVSLYPNPAPSKTVLTLRLREPMNLQLNIIDNIGRTITTISQSAMAGNNTWPIDVSRLPSGTYYLELRGKSFDRRIRFMKM